MTQEEKELLLKDLCGRLSYGVICDSGITIGKLCGSDIDKLINKKSICVKPYLRPMSSMTEEEIVKYCELLNPYEEGDEIFAFYEAHDFLNSIHVDYRGLIKKDLALPALEGMYK